MLNDILGEYPQRLAAMPVVDISLTVAAVVLVSFLAQWVLRQYRLSGLPLINSRGLFESGKKTSDEYLWNAEGLVRRGFTKVSQSTLHVETIHGSRSTVRPSFPGADG